MFGNYTPTIKLPYLVSVEISYKFTFSVVHYKSNIESYIYCHQQKYRKVKVVEKYYHENINTLCDALRDFAPYEQFKKREKHAGGVLFY